jgi:hypothetical protein
MHTTSQSRDGLMSDLTLIVLDFHDSIGPAVQSITGPLNLSNEELGSLRACAFPESMSPLSEGGHVYSFKVAALFCHCIYIKKKSAQAVRGFDQISYVIMTRMGFCQSIFQLLQSMNSIKAHDSMDITALTQSLFASIVIQQTETSPRVHRSTIQSK